MGDSVSEAEDKLNEHQIRPPHLMQGQQIALLTDIGRLLSRRKEFVEVDCPACGVKIAVRKFEKFGLGYDECRECRTLYVTPRPSPEILKWFYHGSENYAYWNEHIFPASEKTRRERIMVPRVDKVLELCLKYRVNMDALLEVGAGFGTFCEELKSRGMFNRVVGVEPTPDLANTCACKGIETIQKPIEEITFSNACKFSVIVSFEVIEHLFSPRDFINNIFQILHPGGLLVLSCPNGKGFDIQTLGPLSDSVDHEHLNYFNPESLPILLADSGYKVLESFTPGKLDAELVRNKVLNGVYDLSGQPFLKRILLDEWERLGGSFQEYLAGQGLSSNMWVVARRPLGNSAAISA